jgi:hypothetical protein
MGRASERGVKAAPDRGRRAFGLPRNPLPPENLLLGQPLTGRSGSNHHRPRQDKRIARLPVPGEGPPAGVQEEGADVPQSAGPPGSFCRKEAGSPPVPPPGVPLSSPYGLALHDMGYLQENPGFDQAGAGETPGHGEDADVVHARSVHHFSVRRLCETATRGNPLYLRKLPDQPVGLMEGLVAQIDPTTDALVGKWLSLPDVASLLGIPAGRVKQLLRDRKLLAVTRPEGTLAVPAAFLDGHQVVKGLCGTLTLLFDCGFDELEALRWLFTADDSLPGTPIDAIVKHRGTEVNRRAQALAF